MITGDKNIRFQKKIHINPNTEKSGENSAYKNLQKQEIDRIHGYTGKRKYKERSHTEDIVLHNSERNWTASERGTKL